MTGQQRAIRWLAAGVLVLWCGVFLRAGSELGPLLVALSPTPVSDGGGYGALVAPL